MALFKNLTGQKIAVYAHDTAADAPKTGDAANITAQLSLDGAATAATNDVNPTELDATDAPGIYIFSMTTAETNGHMLILSAVSATADVSIEPVIIYTLPNWTATQVAQTIDNPTAAAIRAEIDSNSTKLDVAVSTRSTLTAQNVWEYAARTLTANVNGVTIVSAVNGSTITMYQYATWHIDNFTDSALALTDYENLIFVVKEKYSDPDASAILLVDITTGLLYIGKAAASSAGLGVLTKESATAFSLLVAMSEVAGKIGSDYSGSYVWQLKGIDTDDDPDEGFVLVQGVFVLAKAAARAIL